MDYNTLTQFSRNEVDLECLRMLSEGNTQRQVATHMGVTVRSVERRLQRIRAIAAARGWSPEHDMVNITAQGYGVKGTSTLYDEAGSKKLQWVKTSKSHDEMLEALGHIVDGMKEDITPVPAVRFSGGTTRSELMNLHVVSDYHLGMLSYAGETGSDWDLAKAEEMFMQWMQYSIASSPPAKIGVFCNLGDMLHTNGREPVTPASKHVLDVSSRFPQIVGAAIRCIRAVISMMLEKYETVHFISADSNHDPDAGIWIREMFHQLYLDEPRISVDTSHDTFTCLEHGLTSLFFHHGHKKKIKDVDSVFAAKYRPLFGRTKFSYAHMGHLHHIDIKESNLMIVEQHRTMAPSDEYSSSHGYCSGRSAPVITYHKDFGEVSRLTVTPEMLGLF